jgi:hypothetical protein
VSGRAKRTALAVAAIGITIVVAAAALPVPVLMLSDGAREVVASLEEGEALTYSYRQSIYDVPVYEDFVRHGDAIDLLRVRSPDIRSIEYFHWDGDPQMGDDGLWAQDAPPSEHAELVVRLAPLGQQRLTSPRWSYALLPIFGESVVTIRVARRPFAATLAERPG